MDTIEKILKDYWGFDSFRSVQRQIIDSVCSGKDTLGLLPTGGGKSLTFQVPTMAMNGMCLVVTPLISLMKDQVDTLRDIGINAAYIHSGMEDKQIQITLNNSIYGAYKFLYVSPERLESEKFRKYLGGMNICLITIDEAHCICQWGYDFRPSYIKIAEIRDIKPNIPVLALTATAIPMVVNDIQDRLLFKEHNVIRSSFFRSNLSYSTRLLNSEEDKIVMIQKILNGVPGTSVIYRRSREGVEALAKKLADLNISSDFYHAGLDDKDKIKKQEEWKHGDTRVMVATNAFGMGIDKPDVRSVIHYDMPESLEAYFQEAGRAGRDGKKSYAVALYTAQDIGNLSRNLRLSFPSKDFCKMCYDTILRYLKVAINEGMDWCFEFDIWKFCTFYKFNMQQVKSAMLILEQSGYLKYEPEAKHLSRVKFAVNRDELYNSEYDDLPQSANVIMTALMRMYPGIFTDWVFIDEWDIFKHIGYSWANFDDIYKALCVLRSYGVIEYVPGKKSGFLTLLSRRIDADHIIIEKDAYEKRKENATYRLENVYRYVQSKGICRSRLLLHYFGEKEAQDCGICDYCLDKKANRLAMTPEAAWWDNLKSSILDKVRLRNEEITYDMLLYMYQNHKEYFEAAYKQLIDEKAIKVNPLGMLTIAQ